MSTSASAPSSDPSSGADLLAFDRAHLWHPYAPSGSSARLVESASGVRLTLRTQNGEDGPVEVIDGMSSWWAAQHGYQHPALDAALAQQAGRMSHVMFGGLTHEPAVELGRRLLAIAPGSLQRIFFCDSGSVAVEVAIKMCLQYHRGRRGPSSSNRTRMLTVRGGYYGDTLTPMSVCDPVTGMHSMFSDVLPQQVFAPRPPSGYDLPDDDPLVLAWADQVAELAKRHSGALAGVIVEPILQGAGGMFIYSPACLRVLRGVADRHRIPLVLDEIATGFGRTGRLFAAHHAGIEPDLLLAGKALTGGYLTLAAVLVTDEIAAGIDASESGALMHGPTFMANPLACAVAVANLGLLAAGEWQTQVRSIESGLQQGLSGLRGQPGVADVRVIGAVGVVELDHPADVGAASQAALDQGVWLRPFGRLIYTMPPYLCTQTEVATIAHAITAAVTASVTSREPTSSPREPSPAPREPTPSSRDSPSPSGPGGAPTRSERVQNMHDHGEVAVSGDDAFLARLADAAQRRERAGVSRRLDPRAPVQPLLDLAGNDYLGLATDPRVLEGAARAAQAWGGGAGASRLVTGTLTLHAELEQALAAFTGHDSGLVFSTGYLANLGAVCALAGRGDLIVSDAHVHASLVDACRLSRARVAITGHNDVEAVEAVLATRSEGHAIVLAESVYSVLGDAAPLADLAAAGQRHGAVLIVDEAHAIGTAGPAGRGLVAAAGLARRADVVVTGTLSKSLGSQGGFVLSHPAVRDHLINTARSFIYDTGLAPAAAGAALAALGVLVAEPERVTAVRSVAASLAAIAGAPEPAAAVVPVAMPSPQAAVAAAAECARSGVRVGCFRPPSVPDGISRLRLTARATLTPPELARASDALRNGLAVSRAAPLPTPVIAT